jgi:hypothetical protein
MDMVVMNPNVPLELFLPPESSGYEKINLVVTNDHNGLNTGAFFIRISPWSIQLFADIIAMTTYKPELKLKYSEQSAIDILVAQV